MRLLLRNCCYGAKNFQKAAWYPPLKKKYFLNKKSGWTSEFLRSGTHNASGRFSLIIYSMIWGGLWSAKCMIECIFLTHCSQDDHWNRLEQGVQKFFQWISQSHHYLSYALLQKWNWKENNKKNHLLVFWKVLNNLKKNEKINSSWSVKGYQLLILR